MHLFIELNVNSFVQIVPCCGYDCVPSDMGVYLLSRFTGGALGRVDAVVEEAVYETPMIIMIRDTDAIVGERLLLEPCRLFWLLTTHTHRRRYLNQMAISVIPTFYIHKTVNLQKLSLNSRQG